MAGETERELRDLQVVVARHLGECSEQAKTVFNALVRIEKRLDQSTNRLLGWIIGAQAAALSAIFAVWLGRQHWFT